MFCGRSPSLTLAHVLITQARYASVADGPIAVGDTLDDIKKTGRASIFPVVAIGVQRITQTPSVLAGEPSVQIEGLTNTDRVVKMYCRSVS